MQEDKLETNKQKVSTQEWKLSPTPEQIIQQTQRFKKKVIFLGLSVTVLLLFSLSSYFIYVKTLSPNKLPEIPTPQVSENETKIPIPKESVEVSYI